MATSSLSTYLTDHLAGSAAAISLLQRKADGDPFFAELLADVQADRDELQGLTDALGTHAGALKQAGAWIFERLSRLKIAGEALGDHDLEPLLELEVLVLGIRGKHALWTALREVQDDVPQVKALDLDLLIARAEDQISRVEERRRATARTALASA